MNGRINDKIKEIEVFLDKLSEILPINLKDYIKDSRTKAACERYFEKIVEAVIDLAFLIIKERGFKTPEEDKEAFDILSEEKIISDNLAEKLKDAKSMRNILAHKYGTVNDELVFYSLTEELEKDVKEFIKAVKKSKKLK